MLEVTSAEIWTDLCRRHPLVVSASRRHDWYHWTGRTGEWVIPDWASVAEEWGAVHLSLLGYLGLAGRVLPVDDQRASLIAGWSPDETYRFVDIET